MLACPQVIVAERNKILTVRVPEDVHRQMRVRLAQEGVSSQEQVLSLIRPWLASTTGASSELRQKSGKTPRDFEGIADASSVQYTPITESDWRLELAADVLASDHPVASLSLTANIVSFSMLVRETRMLGVRKRAIDPDEAARVAEIAEFFKSVRAFVERERLRAQRANHTQPDKRAA